MSGKIYDAQSMDMLCTEFGELLKDKPVYFHQKKKIGQHVYDAETVGSAGMFIEQQMREILPRILEQKFPGMPGMEIMKNIDNSGAYLQAIIQRIESYQGDFVDINEVSDDKGLITFSRDGKVINIKTKKAYSVYDNITMKRMQQLGEDIDSALLKSHKYKYEQLLDQMIFLGLYDSKNQPVSGSYGLANYPNYIPGLRLDSAASFQSYGVVNDGFGMYSQISKIYNAHLGATEGYEGFYPDTLIVPPLQYSAMRTTPMIVAEGKVAVDTVLTYTERNLNVKVYSSTRLKGQGDGASDRLVLCNSANSENPNMILYIPLPLQFLPIKIDLGDYHIASQFRVAGISINYNNAISYLDYI